MWECWNLDMILEAYRKGDWRDVLELQKLSRSNYLLWPRPEADDVKFISDTIRSCGSDKIVSVGCGSGLLEWSIEKSTGVETIGVEVDGTYWSVTSKPRFLAHKFVGDPCIDLVLSESDTSILFCYFNNYRAFQTYLTKFKGGIIIIIGPNISGRYTMPLPFDDQIPEEWKLYKSKEIANSGDFIAIYTRS